MRGSWRHATAPDYVPQRKREEREMRVAIVGSREYPDLDAVRSFVNRLAEKHPGATVVSGGARGVDSVAVEQAKFVGLDWREFPADWQRHGRRAGYLRNHDIVKNSDIVVAFWDGKSRGTQHTTNLALDAGKQLFVYGPNGLLLTREASDA